MGSGIFLTRSPPYAWRKNPSLNPSVTDQAGPATLRGPLVSASPELGLQAVKFSSWVLEIKQMFCVLLPKLSLQPQSLDFVEIESFFLFFY